MNDYAETIREFIVAQEEPSDFALDALARLEREVASLREQLRLTNDKMAERERAGMWAVADHALCLVQEKDRLSYLERVRDANAPKD